MSQVPLWGTGIGPDAVLLTRRITSEGDLRVTDEGDVRVADFPSASTVPQLFQTDNVTTDGGEPFGFLYRTNPFQPAEEDGTVQGGEHEFKWVNLAIEWSMAATIRVTPIADGREADETLENDDLVQNIPSTFVLPQQTGTLQRKSAIFPIPILRRQMRDGVEINRFNLRGERIEFLLESTGALGTGELGVTGAELESEPVRKATYQTVNSQGTS